MQFLYYDILCDRDADPFQDSGLLQLLTVGAGNLNEGNAKRITCFGNNYEIRMVKPISNVHEHHSTTRRTAPASHP